MEIRLLSHRRGGRRAGQGRDNRQVAADQRTFGDAVAKRAQRELWLGGGAAKAMTNTAIFLKEQGRIQELKPNYASFVTDVYVKKAMAK